MNANGGLNNKQITLKKMWLKKRVSYGAQKEWTKGMNWNNYPPIAHNFKNITP